MLVENLVWEQVLSELEPVISIHEFSVIPSEVEVCLNNQYTEEYAWMYAFEKSVIRLIESGLGRTLPFEESNLLFSVGGCISEALSNAFLHGNKKDYDQRIEVQLAISNKGLGCSIKDQGSGFNFQRIKERYSRGKMFFQVAGNGFKVFNASDQIWTGFLEEGSKMHIMYLFSASPVLIS